MSIRLYRFSFAGVQTCIEKPEGWVLSLSGRRTVPL